MGVVVAVAVRVNVGVVVGVVVAVNGGVVVGGDVGIVVGVVIGATVGVVVVVQPGRTENVQHRFLIGAHESTESKTRELRLNKLPKKALIKILAPPKHLRQ